MKKVLSTLDVTHVKKWTRLSPRIFNGLASSKVICWNYCTRVNIRKEREPGNEAVSVKIFSLTALVGIELAELNLGTQSKATN